MSNAQESGNLDAPAPATPGGVDAATSASPDGTAAAASAAPVAAGERIVSLDVLRGFAILGILLMNIQSFSMISAAYFNPTAFGDLTGLNRFVWTLSHMIADTKFISIFSMLFGAGIVLFASKLESRGLRPGTVHYRRTFWLLLIGLAHGFLLWAGDILTVYALLGFLVYLFWRRSAKALFITGVVVMAFVVPLYVMGNIGLQMGPPEAMEQMSVVLGAERGGGGGSGCWIQRSVERADAVQNERDGGDADELVLLLHAVASGRDDAGRHGALQVGDTLREDVEEVLRDRGSDRARGRISHNLRGHCQTIRGRLVHAVVVLQRVTLQLRRQRARCVGLHRRRHARRQVGRTQAHPGVAGRGRPHGFHELPHADRSSAPPSSTATGSGCSAAFRGADRYSSCSRSGRSSSGSRRSGSIGSGSARPSGCGGR